jgi:hypothetical protein
VVGCCRFLRLIMAWTSILHARQFLVQTSHNPNQCYSYAIIIVFTSATGDQVNKDRISAVIAFRHGRFDSRRRWLSTLMVMVGFVLLLVVIRGGRIGICVLPSKRVSEPKKVYDSRFRTVCVFFTQPCSRASSSARLCKKDTDFSAHNPLLCVKTAHICAYLVLGS